MQNVNINISGGVRVFAFEEIIKTILFHRKSFLFFSLALVIYNISGVYFIYETGESTDYWEHIASMYSFVRNPISPQNPYVLSDEPTHLFTPYHLIWGVVSRSFRAHPFWILPYVAGVNMLLFVTSMRLFSKKFIGDQKYSLVLIITMLFFWNAPWHWSGFYNFGLFPLTSIYPYWFAFPLAIFIITDYAEKIKARSYVLNNLACCLVFLTHPLTGSFLMLSLFLKLLTMRERSIRLRAQLFFGTLVFIVAASAAWPYFPVIRAILGSGEFGEISFAGPWTLFYQDVIHRIRPALLGVPFLIYMLIKKKFHYFNLGLLATGAIYFFNFFVLQNTLLGRYIIFIVFFSHLGIVQYLKHAERYSSQKYILLAYLLIAVFFAAPQFKSSLSRLGPVRDIAFSKQLGTHSNIRIFREYHELKEFITDSDVVMAPMSTSWELPAVAGCKVVGVWHSNPFMFDFQERKQSTEAFFSKGTETAEKLRILSYYSVDYVLVPKTHIKTVEDVIHVLSQIYQTEHYSLYVIND